MNIFKKSLTDRDLIRLSSEKPSYSMYCNLIYLVPHLPTLKKENTQTYEEPYVDFLWTWPRKTNDKRKCPTSANNEKK